LEIKRICMHAYIHTYLTKINPFSYKFLIIVIISFGIKYLFRIHDNDDWWTVKGFLKVFKTYYRWYLP